MKEKSGKWVSEKSTITNFSNPFPPGFDELPRVVQDACRRIVEEESDWIMFAHDEKMWLVSKHWTDITHFMITASVVVYETKEYYGEYS